MVNQIKNVILIIVAGFILGGLIKIFGIAVFSIHSWSMSPNILAGDVILVNKLIPGTRVKDVFSSRNEGKRVLALRKIVRGEIVVFNPYSEIGNKIGKSNDVFYVKRCLGVPGDTVRIVNGFYFINGELNTQGNLAQQRDLSGMSADRLKKIPNIYYCYPKDSVRFGWNIKDFGPLYIPSKGDVITLDVNNYLLYSKLIFYETGERPIWNDNSVWLKGRKINSYLFKSDYYFMAGDNVINSGDSRYWGPISESHIVGKAVLVLNSKDGFGKHRFNRILKTINR